MLPNDFPDRFFNPLVSKHREDYIHVLLLNEAVLEESKRIALPRNALIYELRRMLQRENYDLDVSDEEDYEDQSGHVVNIYSNLLQIRSMPENGLICIQNAHESTQRLLTNLNIVFVKIKAY